MHTKIKMMNSSSSHMNDNSIQKSKLNTSSKSENANLYMLSSLINTNEIIKFVKKFENPELILKSKSFFFYFA